MITDNPNTWLVFAKPRLGTVNIDPVKARIALDSWLMITRLLTYFGDWSALPLELGKPSVSIIDLI